MPDGRPLAVSRYQSEPKAWELYARLALVLLAEVPGGVAEFGVGSGETARELARIMDRAGSGKSLHLFESFQGLPAPSFEDENGAYPNPAGMYAHGREEADHVLRVHLYRVEFHPGLFSEHAGFCAPLCFAHVDCDLYASTRDALAICERVIVPHGVIVCDNLGPTWPGVEKACRALHPDRWWLTQAHHWEPGWNYGQLVATRKP